MGLFSPDSSREKRQDCRQCGGLGRVFTTTTHKIKDRRTGEVTKVKDQERVKCPKCKGSGYR